MVVTLEQTAPDDLFAGPARRGPGPLRIGVVGAAGAGVPHLRSLTDSVPGARVTLVQDDGDAGRLRELADHAGAGVARYRDDVVTEPDLDAVVIAVPDPVETLLTCLEAGVPAYVDPGRLLDPDDVRRVVNLEAAVGRRLLQVGFVRRHDPAYLGLRRVVVDGEVGALRLLRSVDRGGRVGAPTVAWPADVVAAMDVAAWLLGDLDSARVEVAGGAGPLLTTLGAASGAVGSVEVFADAPYGHEARCEVVGTGGAVELAPPVTVVTRHGATSVGRTHAEAAGRFADAHRIALVSWVRSLGSGVPIGASAWDWYVASSAVAAAASSTVTGTRVPIDPGPAPTVYLSAPPGPPEPPAS